MAASTIARAARAARVNRATGCTALQRYLNGLVAHLLR